MAQMFSNAIAYEEMMGRWSTRLATLFLDFADIDDADSILDVGCGTGSLVKGILERTRRARVVGIDPAEPFINYARARFADTRARFDCGSASDLPYADASFDHSLSLLVFQFLNQPGVAASEMRRVTRPGALGWDRTLHLLEDLLRGKSISLAHRAWLNIRRPRGRRSRRPPDAPTAIHPPLRAVPLRIRSRH